MRNRNRIVPGRPGGAAALRSTARTWLAALLLITTGCDREAVVIGVTSRAELVDAARLAVSDAGHEALAQLDTVMVEEDPTTTAPAVSTAERFVGIPRLIGVVGHVNSATSLAAARVYNEAGVVQIAPTSTAIAYREMGPFSFRLVPADDRQGDFLADFVEENFPPDVRVAILYVNDDYGRGLREVVTGRLEATPALVVLDLPHVDRRDDVLDFSYTAEAVAANDPDLILWFGRAGTLNSLLGVLRGTGLATPLIASDAAAAAVQYPNDDGRWYEVRYVDFVNIDATGELRAFRRRYRDRFRTDVGGLDALHYDAMSLLMAGVRAGSRTGEELRDYLLSLGRDRPPFQGITGPVSFGPNGEVDRSYVMRRVDAPGTR